MTTLKDMCGGGGGGEELREALSERQRENGDHGPAS